jgi:tetratricopeptide (TPR) repeat protein
MKVYDRGKELSRLLRVAGCILFFVSCYAVAAGLNELIDARDRQDLNAIDNIIKQYQQNVKTADEQYRLALAYSYGAEVATEVHDKHKAAEFAEAGLDPAKKAVAANGNNAEYHRLLGELCGQAIPANPVMGTLKYGQCARDEIDKAIQLDPKLALAYVSRGVGTYYLPAQMGGGPEVAIKDFDKAIALDPKLGDAYLWKGVALHKLNKDPEARQALQRAEQLQPNRIWVKEQLAKTPTR